MSCCVYSASKIYSSPPAAKGQLYVRSRTVVVLLHFVRFVIPIEYGGTAFGPVLCSTFVPLKLA